MEERMSRALAYKQLNDIVKESGFIVDKENHVIVMDNGLTYFELKIVEHDAGELIKHLDINVIFKPQNRLLDGACLFVLAEEARCCSNIMKRMESLSDPITFTDELNGDFVCCRECSYWKEQNDNDYGTCKCKHSTTFGCRTISFHKCRLK